MAHHPLHTRRSPLSQSHTRFMGMEGHTESLAGASVAQEQGAAVPSRGAMGPRQCDSAQWIRQRQSTATPLVLLSEAGPGGYGR